MTPGKDSNYINYQQFMSGVFPGAYIRAGGWGTNLTTGTHQWYARALIVCACSIWGKLYVWDTNYAAFLEIFEVWLSAKAHSATILISSSNRKKTISCSFVSIRGFLSLSLSLDHGWERRGCEAQCAGIR